MARKAASIAMNEAGGAVKVASNEVKAVAAKGGYSKAELKAAVEASEELASGLENEARAVSNDAKEADRFAKEAEKAASDAEALAKALFP